MGKKTTIRTATHDDIGALLDIASAMHAESPRFSRLSFSTAKMMQLFLNLIESDAGLLLVAEQGGNITGGFAGMVAPHWFSDDLVASDFGVFILPEYRGGMAAVRMVRAYIAWAKKRSAKLIQLGISTGVMTGETVELYRAIGLKQFSIGFEV